MFHDTCCVRLNGIRTCFFHSVECNCHAIGWGHGVISRSSIMVETCGNFVDGGGDGGGVFYHFYFVFHYFYFVIGCRMNGWYVGT